MKNRDQIQEVPTPVYLSRLTDTLFKCLQKNYNASKHSWEKCLVFRTEYI